jgi:hypothetical protein
LFRLNVFGEAIPSEQGSILLIRGKRVMLDSDIATKQSKEYQNPRFPLASLRYQGRSLPADFAADERALRM